jgi:5'-phosphate synthase pdxT subunit
MVKQLKIGILGIQGAISEHVSIMKQILNHQDNKSKISIIRTKSELEDISGLIIPGGESTTISRFLLRNDLHNFIKKRVNDHSLSVMGTCAGCVLVASEIDDQGKELTLLSLMNMKVKRNAFGRQRESFEQNIHINGIQDTFPAVFIRAPLILKTWGNCIPLAQMQEGIVMSKQDNMIALSFHPELTKDRRVHEYFYNMVKSYTKN